VANKNRKKRQRARKRAGGGASSSSSPSPSPSSSQQATAVDRRQRKEQARKAKEAERKRAARAASVRRALIFSVVGLVALGIFYWMQRASSPDPIPQAAVTAAQEAGCTGVETPVGNAPGGQHLAEGETFVYDRSPATSGRHDPSPLPVEPKVYPVPVPETRAVHFLEHAGVIVYYRADGEGALPADVVQALTATVESDASANTLLAPYPDLPAGTSLALAAWNKLQTCPGQISATQAQTVTSGFVESLACSSNAPEANASEAC
jgi:hypothetical protein